MPIEYTKEYQGPATAQCEVCDGHGYVSSGTHNVRNGSTWVDACPKCARLAEKLYDLSRFSLLYTSCVHGTFSKNLRKVA